MDNWVLQKHSSGHWGYYTDDANPALIQAFWVPNKYSSAEGANAYIGLEGTALASGIRVLPVFDELRSGNARMIAMSISSELGGGSMLVVPKPGSVTETQPLAFIDQSHTPLPDRAHSATDLSSEEPASSDDKLTKKAELIYVVSAALIVIVYLIGFS